MHKFFSSSKLETLSCKVSTGHRQYLTCEQVHPVLQRTVVCLSLKSKEMKSQKDTEVIQ